MTEFKRHDPLNAEQREAWEDMLDKEHDLNAALLRLSLLGVRHITVKVGGGEGVSYPSAAEVRVSAVMEVWDDLT